MKRKVDIQSEDLWFQAEREDDDDVAEFRTVMIFMGLISLVIPVLVVLMR